MKKKVLFIGNFNLLQPNAAGLRVLGLSKIFGILGYQSAFIGLRSSDDLEKDTDWNFEPPSYKHLCTANGLSWLLFRSRLRSITEEIEKVRPEFVVLYGSQTIFLLNIFIRLKCRRLGVRVLYDVVDWLESVGGSSWYRFVKNIDTYFLKRVEPFRVDGIIVISTFLRSYYERRASNVVLIPPVFNTDNFFLSEFREEIDKQSIWIYAGLPFSVNSGELDKSNFKDRLDIIIDLFYTLRDKNFRFIVYGLTADEYLSVVPNDSYKIKALSNKIEFKGKVSNSVVKLAYETADYVILIRDKKRSSSAGFPTKIAEAVSHGVRAVTNDFGDMKLYLEDSKFGYILQSPESYISEMTDLISKSKMLNSEISGNDNYPFNYLNYSCEISDLINRAK